MKPINIRCQPSLYNAVSKISGETQKEKVTMAVEMAMEKIDDMIIKKLTPMVEGENVTKNLWFKPRDELYSKMVKKTEDMGMSMSQLTRYVLMYGCTLWNKKRAHGA